MKKNLLFVSALVWGAMVSAQSLTAPYIQYMQGETIVYHFSTTQEDPGAATNGTTWDFSSFTDDQTVTAQVTANSGGQFSTANIKVTQDNGAEVYFLQNSSLTEMQGLVSGSVVLDYTNPLTVLSFPINSTSNVTDNFSATFDISGYTFVRSGTSQTEYSGSGTLITPEGTATNVIRLKTTQIFTDVYDLGTINYQVVAYNWYKAGIHHELANVSVTTSTQGTTYQNQYTDLPANLGLSQHQELDVIVFPNPTTESVHVVGDMDIQTVVVNDLSGKLVEVPVTKLSTETVLDFSMLSSGCYSITMTDINGQSIVKQVTKK